MKEKKKQQKEFREEDQDYLLAASATECTGLFPSAPQNEDEIENYEQIQAFLPPTYGLTKDEKK